MRRLIHSSREIGGEIFKMEWSQADAWAALRCVPAVALTLAAGLFFGQPTFGMAAASGAVTVAFGSFQQTSWSRTAPMLLGSIGVAVSALSGALFGHWVIGAALVAGAWGLWYGLLSEVEAGVSWVGLQCVIFAIISGGYPVSVGYGFARAGFILAGGLLQLLCVLAFWRMAKIPFRDPPAEATAGGSPRRQGIRDALAIIKQSLIPGTMAGHYPWQLAITLGLTAGVCRWLAPPDGLWGFSLPNGYWVPMTVVLVLKPDFRQTFTRGVARLVGTLLGAALATLLAATLRPEPTTLAALVVAASSICFILLKVNYAVFVVFLTAYVVFLLSFAGLPEHAVVVHRMVNTALGGAVALLAYAHIIPLQFWRGRVGQRQADVPSSKPTISE